MRTLLISALLTLSVLPAATLADTFPSDAGLRIADAHKEKTHAKRGGKPDRVENLRESARDAVRPGSDRRGRDKHGDDFDEQDSQDVRDDNREAQAERQEMKREYRDAQSELREDRRESHAERQEEYRQRLHEAETDAERREIQEQMQTERAATQGQRVEQQKQKKPWWRFWGD